MKVVDEKGKVFGKINIIDLIVILAVVVALVLLGGKFLGDRGEDDPEALVPGENYLMTFDVKITSVLPELYDAMLDAFENGDTQCMVNGGIEVTGTKVAAIRSEPSGATVVTDSGERLRVEDPYLLDVYYTMSALTDKPDTHITGTQEIRIDRNYTVKTRNVEVTGIIVSFRMEKAD